MTGYRDLLNPKYLLSLPTFFATLVFALLTHLVDTAHNVNGHFLERFVIVTFIHFFIFFYMWVVNVLVLKRVERSALLYLVLGTIISAAALRGLLIYSILKALGIENGVGLAFRMQASITNIGLAILVATLAVAFSSSHAASTNRLIADQRKLRQLRDATIEKINLFDETFKNSIATQLQDSISAFKGAKSEDALKILRLAIDQVVRPLSEILDKQTRGILESPSQDVAYKINWKRVFSKSTHIDRISEVPIILALILFGGSALVHDFPLRTSLLEIASVLFLGILLIKISKIFFARVTKRLKRVPEALFMFLSLYLPGQFLGLESYFVIKDSQHPGQFIFLIPVFTVLLGLLFAVFNSARREALEVRVGIEIISAELNWELARARELNRQQQRLLSFTLHGQIQAAMEAAFIKLRLAIDSGVDNDSLRSSLAELIESAVTHIYRNFKSPDSLDSVLVKIRDTWNGIAEVTWDIPSEVLKKVAADPISNTALIDLITEMSFNAVKHGKASSIKIACQEVDYRILELSVSNDGNALEPSERRGLGSKLLDESTTYWNRFTEQAKTVTIAHIPIVSGKTGGDEEI
ncbi:hypothetical protein MCEMZLE2_01408 [Candidatus Nanopelagicaceae bacterium]